MKLIKNYREYGALSYFPKIFKASATNSAFTLAEMMVVMLILSVILAAMAPVMTTRQLDIMPVICFMETIIL